MAHHVEALIEQTVQEATHQQNILRKSGEKKVAKIDPDENYQQSKAELRLAIRACVAKGITTEQLHSSAKELIHNSPVEVVDKVNEKIERYERRARKETCTPSDKSEKDLIAAYKHAISKLAHDFLGRKHKKESSKTDAFSEFVKKNREAIALHVDAIKARLAISGVNHPKILEALPSAKIDKKDKKDKKEKKSEKVESKDKDEKKVKKEKKEKSDKKDDKKAKKEEKKDKKDDKKKDDKKSKDKEEKKPKKEKKK